MAKRKSKGGRKPGHWQAGLSGEKLRAWREQAKVSRGKLAKALGKSATSVQNWETGRAIPVQKTQHALVEIMRSGVAQLQDCAQRRVDQDLVDSISRRLGGGQYRVAATVQRTVGENADREAAVITATGQIVAACVAARHGKAGDVGALIATVMAGLSS